ncbi:hypothetical protein [Aeoliella mucimassa]|uniref:Uncharacterized protein n=1 Tax=Aeoliella mucimassa TaxID=2527972 RepID=A0A518AW50_9BACT|nr:hypothetical protein [Aeoliella mucimassa]QDU58938.1 hypothetical protein Pan181_51790 [Aeoliella mucimassa]
MAKSDKERLNQVITEVLDEGLSAERMAELEDLLLDNPELQAYYTDALKLNTLMRYELSGGLHHATPLVASEPVDTTTLIQQLVEADAATPQGTSQATSGVTNWKSIAFWVATLAASLLIAVGVYSVLSPGGSQHAPSDRSLAHAAGETPGAHGQSSETLLVNDPQQLATLSRITKTEMITRVMLPGSTTNSRQASVQRLVGGNAWIDRSPGGRERGYVVELASGYRMDVRVDADAGNQNALGIVELDSRGRMTGDTFSFNNLPTESDTSWRRYGNIGAITLENKRAQSRYFLFAGSHVNLGNPSAGWKQSDYKLLHESSDFLVLGWDDSGYLGEEVDETRRDQDFNDVCAVLHFAPFSSTRQTMDSSVFYLPALTANLPTFTGAEPGHPFHVKPGQEVMLLVSDSARIPSSALIVEQDTQSIIWRDDAVGKESLPLDSPNETSMRGIYVIKNNTSTVKRYAIHAGRYDETDTWVEMPYRLNGEDDHWECIGFEDSPEGPMGVDWNDIQVHARWFEN